jgi:hypothetical protein
VFFWTVFFWTVFLPCARVGVLDRARVGRVRNVLLPPCRTQELVTFLLERCTRHAPRYAAHIVQQAALNNRIPNHL